MQLYPAFRLTFLPPYCHFRFYWKVTNSTCQLVFVFLLASGSLIKFSLKIPGFIIKECLKSNLRTDTTCLLKISFIYSITLISFSFFPFSPCLDDAFALNAQYQLLTNNNLGANCRVGSWMHQMKFKQLLVRYKINQADDESYSSFFR